MAEEWKDINGYEGKYQISNIGNVKSLNYNNTGKEKLLKQKINRYGYNEVKLSKNNKTKNFLVSTLVAKHFIKNRNADMEVMHIGDTHINSVDNLKFGYRSEILHLTYKKGNRSKGNPTKYKMSYKGVQYKRMSDLARHYKLKPSLLYKRIRNGWTLDEALNIPYDRKEKILNKQLYEYKGKLMSVKQLAEMSGKTRGNIYKRIAAGWSIEEAVEIPVARRKGKK